MPEIIKIGKVEKLVANLHNKVEYVIQVKNLKQALNHGLTLKKVHGIIKFNQKKLVKTIHWYEDRSKKNISKNIFLNWWIMKFLKKSWKMSENTDILNL